jgi:hypothetical protein
MVLRLIESFLRRQAGGDARVIRAASQASRAELFTDRCLANLATFMGRSGQRGFHGVARTQTGEDGCGMQADATSPFGYGQSFPSERDHLAATGVELLLGVRGPTAVGRLVRAVVVDPLNGVTTGGSLAHIGDEAPEVIHPAIAHADPSATVVAIVPRARVDTAFDYLRPHVVERVLGLVFHAVSLSPIGQLPRAARSGAC